MQGMFPFRFLVCLGVTFGGLIVFVAAPRVSASAQADLRERTLFVSAVDSKGEPVADLEPADFVVREDGALREVLRVTRATEPIDIALLVDNSAAAASAILHIREGVARFVARMAPGNQIAIIGLADRPTILVDYTSDATRLADGASRLFAMPQSGMTLLDAIVETSRGLERRESSRAVIVSLLTDGVEFSNRYYRDVVESVLAARAALHAVTVGQFPVTNDPAIRERAFVLDGGTGDSGGQWMALLSSTAIPTSLEKLARELSSQYKVVYSRPESLIPPETLAVTSARPGITMRAAPLRAQGGA